jgi:hypothetical protein
MRFSSSAGVGFTEYGRIDLIGNVAKSVLTGTQLGVLRLEASHVAFSRVHARPTLRATLIGVTAIPGFALVSMRSWSQRLLSCVLQPD